MTVTFQPNNVPYVDFYYDDGDHIREPEVYANFANVNARVLFDMMGLGDLLADGLAGRFEGKTLDRVIRGIIKAYNNTRVEYTRPSIANGTLGWGGCRLIDPGATDESMRRRMELLLAVCAEAKRTGDTVVYG